jgi:hypothetical protein
MRLYVDSHLPANAATAWEIFEGPDFQRRLEADTGLRTEVLEERQEGSVTVRKLRYVSKSELPTVAATALGSKNLSYEQENRLDLASGKLTWVVKIPLAGDRVKASGTTVIQDAPGGSRRVVEGDVTISVPFVGGTIEKAVVGEFEKSMARAVEIAKQIMKERGLG